MFKALFPLSSLLHYITMRGPPRERWGYKLAGSKIKSKSATYLIVYIGRESKPPFTPSIICREVKKFLETFKIYENVSLTTVVLTPTNGHWPWSVILWSLRLNTLWRVQNRMISSDKYSLFLIVLLDFLKSTAYITFKSFFLKQKHCHGLRFTKFLHTIKAVI